MSNTGNKIQPQTDAETHRADASDWIDGGRSVAFANAANWIGEGWALFTKAPAIWIVNIVIVCVLWTMLAFIPVLGGLLSSLLMPGVLGGLMLGCRALDNGNSLQVEHVFAGFKDHAGPLMLVGLLVLVATISIFIITGIIALVVLGAGFLQSLTAEGPALTNLISQYGVLLFLLLCLIGLALFVPVSMAYWFAPALVVFHGLDAVTAMKQSFIGCMRNVMPFLLYGILLLVLMILGIIPLLLGLLIVIPMMYGSMYASYKDIYRR